MPGRILEVRVLVDRCWHVIQPIPYERLNAWFQHYPGEVGRPTYYSMHPVGAEIEYFPLPQPGTVIEVTREQETVAHYQTTFTSGVRGMDGALMSYRPEDLRNMAAHEQARLNALWAQQMQQAPMPDHLRGLLMQEALGQQRNPAPPPFSPEVLARAKQLLEDHLTPEQLEDWTRCYYFTVRGSLSNTYELAIDRVTRTTDRHSFCLQVVGEPVPVYDAILARKLLLESDEAQFLATANDLSVNQGLASSNALGSIVEQLIGRLLGRAP